MIYLPYSDFTKSTLSLDSLTLLHQVDEIISVLEVCHETEVEVAHVNRSLLAAWNGFEPQLCQLGLLSMEALRQRKLDETGKWKRAVWHLECATSGNYTLAKPSWVGDEAIHTSHQSILLQLDPMHYRKYFKLDNTYPLIWP